MTTNLFSYIFAHTKKQQIFISLVIWCYYPFYLLSLELAKRIINLIEHENFKPPYDVDILGDIMLLGLDFSQLTLIWIFSLLYLSVVFINGGFKYYINVYKGRLGERLLRRLRYRLFHHVLRFPLRYFRHVRQGEMVTMVVSEVEPIGGFAGTAYADPQFHGGIFVIALGYIIWQDAYLGAAALALFPVQMYLVPKLQNIVNQLAKERVVNVRELSSELDESIGRIIDIRSLNTERYELARMAKRLAANYFIRLKIYRIKFFIKFLNNFADKLTPFFFYMLGGYLVIEGRLDIGSLFAILAA
ncbi:MAG: ABC transporter transmembrane domain-containing protein [Pseudomonadota bacterium]